MYLSLMSSLFWVATGEGILLLMDVMGWKKAFLISTEGGDYGELGRGVRDVSPTVQTPKRAGYCDVIKCICDIVMRFCDVSCRLTMYTTGYCQSSVMNPLNAIVT